MKLEEQESHNGLNRVAVITISRKDLMEVKFDNWDLKLIDDCGKSNKISDKLLMLEMIARRIEESNSKTVEGGSE